MARMKLKAKGWWQWVEISPEIDQLMQEQLQRFRDKFGRDPGPGDPVFFDSDKETPQPLDPTSYTRE
jgi:hypothetical protein